MGASGASHRLGSQRRWFAGDILEASTCVNCPRRGPSVAVGQLRRSSTSRVGTRHEFSEQKTGKRNVKEQLSA
jgi:hypothetical protein